MAKNNIFITGADGFIGSHLVEKLIYDGYKVRALAQYNSFNNFGWLDHLNNEVKGDFEKIMGDVRDLSQITELMKGYECVLHLASLIGIPYSYIAPQSYIDTNVTGTLNVLQAARYNDVSKIVHTSTSEVYGTAQFVPMNEKHPLVGQSPYAASKIAADQIAYSFYTSYKTPVSICRPFNTYGPRQSLRAVIPTIIVQILNGSETIQLGNLMSTRDFNFIEDTVSGFISILKNKKNNGQVYNIGSNYEIKICDVLKIISKKMKFDIKVETKNNRMRPENSEVNRLWADNTKALKLLNWKPQYNNLTGFEKGIEKTISWFKNKKNIKKYTENNFVI